MKIKAGCLYFDEHDLDQVLIIRIGERHSTCYSLRDNKYYTLSNSFYNDSIAIKKGIPRFTLIKESKLARILFNNE